MIDALLASAGRGLDQPTATRNRARSSYVDVGCLNGSRGVIFSGSYRRGFWDEQQRVAKLQEKKPVLTRLAETIPWESFRPLLDKGYSQERKSNAGRKRIDPLILFKMLVLQQLFNLSDEEIEFQVNDRRSFEEFVGLGVMNDIPDARQSPSSESDCARRELSMNSLRWPASQAVV
ncbi:transposase [Synechococcus sp. 8F6]|uniref:transposase n=1 Tax=Synechococcus sp. 8F6 TaxID=2025606 RepID=UPI001E6334D0|nr:transposase [Synechococcus sp. 8F6]